MILAAKLAENLIASSGYHPSFGSDTLLAQHCMHGLQAHSLSQRMALSHLMLAHRHKQPSQALCLWMPSMVMLEVSCLLLHVTLLMLCSIKNSQQNVVAVACECP